MSSTEQARWSAWPHRLAIALALITFPLIWVGGLVTTYDAGMAVPDWPGTYGYNLFRYPWQTWFAGPFDLFIEHGHRLLGAAAGLVAIALVVAAWITLAGRHIVLASLGALLLVIVQGVLGGARVLADERLLALVHGCVGPLFFAYLARLIILTAPRRPSPAPNHDGRFLRRTLILVGLVYFQLVLGAILRHIPLSASPTAFRAVLVMHLLVAAALLVQIILQAIRAFRTAHFPLAVLLGLLISSQIMLGGSTYVVKYAFPAWLHGFQFAAAFVVQEKSLWQSLIATAHAATGSLILFIAAWQATLAARPYLLASSDFRRSAGRLPTLIFAESRSAAA